MGNTPVICFPYRVSMLQNVLDDIVPVLILQQRLRVPVKFLKDWSGLLCNAVLENPLDDATTVRMSGQRVDLKSSANEDLF